MASLLPVKILLNEFTFFPKTREREPFEAVLNAINTVVKTKYTNVDALLNSAYVVLIDENTNRIEVLRKDKQNVVVFLRKYEDTYSICCQTGLSLKYSFLIQNNQGLMNTLQQCLKIQDDYSQQLKKALTYIDSNQDDSSKIQALQQYIHRLESELKS